MEFDLAVPPAIDGTDNTIEGAHMSNMEFEIDSAAFSVWRGYLTGDRSQPLILDRPNCGYYRRRTSKNGVRVPVAFLPGRMRADGSHDWTCVIDGKIVDKTRGLEAWQWCEPVTRDAYTAVIEGHPWPDIDATVHAHQQAARGIGDNRGPTDPFDVLREQIESASAGASIYAKIDSDEIAARAQTLRSRLLELSGAANKKRETESDPHWTAYKAINERWNPLVNAAKATANTIRAALEAWQGVKLAREIEIEQRKVAEARAATAESAGVAPPPPPPPSSEPVIRGAAGRAASVRVYPTVTGIEDIGALFAYMRERAEIATLLIKLAQRDVDAGRTVPGVKIEQKPKVR